MKIAYPVFTKKKDEFTVEGRHCIAYGHGSPRFLLLQPVDEHDIEALSDEVDLLSDKADESILLVAFKTENWNDELSPWPMPAVFGKDGFAGSAGETLLFLEKNLLPRVRERYDLGKDVRVVLGGYSLAGLFSLWSGYQTDAFDAIAAASPSVWFAGWVDYVRGRRPLTDTIYLSLGDREEKARNQTMSRVGDAIRTQADILREQDITSTLEWNNGVHFQDSGIRTARGFLWCMETL